VDWEDIPKGTGWLNEIYAGIEGADIFVFIISPDSLASEVCTQGFAQLREALQADGRGAGWGHHRGWALPLPAGVGYVASNHRH
jgi:hypothetical protein